MPEGNQTSNIAKSSQYCDDSVRRREVASKEVKKCGKDVDHNVPVVHSDQSQTVNVKRQSSSKRRFELKSLQQLDNRRQR